MLLPWKVLKFEYWSSFHESLFYKEIHEPIVYYFIGKIHIINFHKFIKEVILELNGGTIILHLLKGSITKSHPSNNLLFAQ